MKAIQTRYQGRLFRSRLEARWCVFMDRTWMRWEYEPEGIDLPTSYYLPDFALRTDAPGVLMWVEIKARGGVVDRSITLLTEMAHESGEHCFLLAGNPRPGEFVHWHFDPNGDVTHTPHTLRFPHVPEMMLQATDVPWENVSEALRVATAARFEHGQTPNPDGLVTAGDVMRDLMRGPTTGHAIRKGELLEKMRRIVEGDKSA